jgi:hypothetical protein
MSAVQTPVAGPAADQIMQMATGFWVSKTVFTGLELGVFEALAGRPKTIGEIQSSTGLPADGLGRLLTGLASLGLIHRQGDTWANSENSERHLVSSSPAFIGGIFAHFSYDLYPLWRYLPDAVKAETPRWGQAFGLPDDANPFAPMYEDPQRLAGFMQTMHALAMPVVHELVERYDFSSYHHLMDVGGALGSLPVAVLPKYPELRATILELPPVQPHAEAFIAKHGLSDRITVVTGDFLRAPLPTGADIITLGYIIHDWNDAESVGILQRCYEALEPGGTILISEKILNDDKTGPVPAALMNLNMLTAMHGRERTIREYTAILESAGFTDVQSTIYEGPRDVITARKI